LPDRDGATSLGDMSKISAPLAPAPAADSGRGVRAETTARRGRPPKSQGVRHGETREL